MAYYIKKKVSISYDEAIDKLKDELSKQGFGILTHIDVKNTLKEKLGVDFDRYMILGACNPKLSHTAIETERDIGVLLPCNVIVYELEGEVYVSAINPQVAFSVVKNENLENISEEVKSRLEKVMEKIY